MQEISIHYEFVAIYASDKKPCEFSNAKLPSGSEVCTHKSLLHMRDIFNDRATATGTL